MMHSGSRIHGSPVKTIGFLVDWIDGAYQNQILDGARDAARDRRVQLLCFSGGILESDARGGLRRNATFELASRRRDEPLTATRFLRAPGRAFRAIPAKSRLAQAAEKSR